jgi:hypothetical protein
MLLERRVECHEKHISTNSISGFKFLNLKSSAIGLMDLWIS